MNYTYCNWPTNDVIVDTILSVRYFAIYYGRGKFIINELFKCSDHIGWTNYLMPLKSSKIRKMCSISLSIYWLETGVDTVQRGQTEIRLEISDYFFCQTWRNYKNLDISSKKHNFISKRMISPESLAWFWDHYLSGTLRYF